MGVPGRLRTLGLRRRENAYCVETKIRLYPSRKISVAKGMKVVQNTRDPIKFPVGSTKLELNKIGQT